MWKDRRSRSSGRGNARLKDVPTRARLHNPKVGVYGCFSSSFNSRARRADRVAGARWGQRVDSKKEKQKMSSSPLNSNVIIQQRIISHLSLDVAEFGQSSLE